PPGGQLVLMHVENPWPPPNRGGLFHSGFGSGRCSGGAIEPIASSRVARARSTRRGFVGAVFRSAARFSSHSSISCSSQPEARSRSLIGGGKSPSRPSL